MRVKICGVRTRAVLDAAAEAGAAYVGLVFFPKSSRHLSWDEGAALAAAAPPGLCKVALTVDPDDETLATLAGLPLDMIQLHGAETPARAAEVRARLGLPVMKAVGIASVADLPKLDLWSGAVDQILVDAKPPKESAVPGGAGVPFDWSLIAGRRWASPWMLAGGLTPENAAEAARLTGATQLDLSSGVESAPGVKDPALIRSFLAAVS